MTKNEKVAAVAELVEKLNANDFVYLANTDGMTAGNTNAFRRMLFQNGVEMRMVKNTLLKIAMEESGKDFTGLYGSLKGTTCVMFSAVQKAPAKALSDFRGKAEMPALKGAWIDNGVFLGDAALKDLLTLKTREEMIGDIVALLQSPAKNVISALQSNAGQKLAGLVKALEERA
ncbi:MAG: 50S ribosomal protein L10 [Bacteroidia bacterium]